MGIGSLTSVCGFGGCSSLFVDGGGGGHALLFVGAGGRPL